MKIFMEHVEGKRDLGGNCGNCYEEEDSTWIFHEVLISKDSS